jgi:hypothetical protein
VPYYHFSLRDVSEFLASLKCVVRGRGTKGARASYKDDPATSPVLLPVQPKGMISSSCGETSRSSRVLAKAERQPLELTSRILGRGTGCQGVPRSLPRLGRVCIILPILTNPSAAEHANSNGFTYVMSRMRFYVELEHLLYYGQRI